jgi:uncharacterized protein YndB with AHSA1/START domain
LEVTTPSDRELVMTREFAAPRQLVFAALTQPELLVRWFGARGWNLVQCVVDLRVGGSWRFVSRGPDGSEMGHGGVYREIVAPARLVYTEVFDDQSYPGESLITQQLTERHGLTTLTSTVVYPSPEARDYVLSTPMERGVSQAYERLDRALADLVDLADGADGRGGHDSQTGQAEGDAT